MLSTDSYEASRGYSATAEPLVKYPLKIMCWERFICFGIIYSERQ